MIAYKLLPVIALLTLATARAQQSDSSKYIFLSNEESRDFGLVTGVHQGHTTFFELGLSRTISGPAGCALGSYFRGRSLSVEYNPFQNKAGLTLTSWTSIATMMTLGANIHTYSDFENYNLGFKPFIGIGNGDFSLTYGYNFEFINRGIPSLNRHCFSVRYHWSIIQQK